MSFAVTFSTELTVSQEHNMEIFTGFYFDRSRNMGTLGINSVPYLSKV